MERRVVINAELQGEEAEFNFYNLLAPLIWVYESEYSESLSIKADIRNES
jgi:hypothetical protein